MDDFFLMYSLMAASVILSVVFLWGGVIRRVLATAVLVLGSLMIALTSFSYPLPIDFYPGFIWSKITTDDPGGIFKDFIISDSRVDWKNKKIYLFGSWKDSVKPRYYSMPWSKERARKLEEAMRKRGAAVLNLPYQHTWSPYKGANIYPLPIPKLPDKLDQEEPDWKKHPGGEA